MIHFPEFTPFIKWKYYPEYGEEEDEPEQEEDVECDVHTCWVLGEDGRGYKMEYRDPITFSLMSNLEYSLPFDANYFVLKSLFSLS